MCLADREFDANKHCGVVMEDSGKPCTRSLTCKVICNFLLAFSMLIICINLVKFVETFGFVGGFPTYSNDPRSIPRDQAWFCRTLPVQCN